MEYIEGFSKAVDMSSYQVIRIVISLAFLTLIVFRMTRGRRR